MRTPWLLGEVEWTPDLEAEAVLWLSRQTKKPILHLSTPTTGTTTSAR